MVIQELAAYIQSNPDPRELKRALAVQMAQHDYPYIEIQTVLQVSVSFISKWTNRFK